MASIDFSSNPSLNEIVSSLAARVNKPFDNGLMAELKHIVRYKRSSMMRDYLIAVGMRDWFLQTFNAKTVKLSASECAEFPTDCYVVRTECKIPAPFVDPRVKTPAAMFEYVGHISGYQAYAYLDSSYMSVLKHKPYTSGKRKWFYQNGYIYIVNEIVTGAIPPEPSFNNGDSIKVRGVFNDYLNDINCDICDASGNTCEKDDAAFPVPPELLDKIVQSILSIELASGDLPKDTEEDKDQVKVDTIENVVHQNI
jgi:hypothetical protein